MTAAYLLKRPCVKIYAVEKVVPEKIQVSER